MGTAAAARVAAARDRLSPCHRLADPDVDGRQVSVSGGVSVAVIDQDGLPETGIDRVASGELDGAFGRRQDVLVTQGVVPSVVPVVVEIVGPAVGLRVAQRKRWIDAVAPGADGAVELADLAIGGVVGIAVVEDRGDGAPGCIGAGQELDRACDRGCRGSDLLPG